MTDTKATSPVTFQIINRDFTDTLTTALGFASKNDTLPMLNGVDLNIHRGRLIATATDRFRLALVRATIYEFKGTDGRLGFLDYTVARKLLALFKSPRRGRSTPPEPLTITVANETITVDNGTEQLTVALSTAITPPKVWGLITESIARKAGDSRDWAVNPKLLASFGLVGGHANVRVNNAERPLVIAIGDDFIGLQMPVRMPDGGHEETFSEWSNFLAPVKAPRKRAPRKAAPAKAAAPKRRSSTKKAATA